MADIGGVNSFRSFARSWQRAASFHEVIPRRPSFVYSQDQAVLAGDTIDGIDYQRGNIYQPPPQSSLLRQHLEASPPHTALAGPSTGLTNRGELSREDFRDRESKAFDAELATGALPAMPTSSSRSSIFAVPPHLAAPSIIGSYGSHRSSQYGTITGGSLRARPSIVRVTGHGDVGDDDDDAAHGEEQPILVKEVKQGNKFVLTVEGQSTLPQSIFNSINAIIGVGLLSLPLAFKMSGWILGLTILTLTAAVTAHTAKLLAKCMEYDPSLITYSDLAYVSFGPRARVVVSALFTLELVAACVALIILFSDSLALLIPSLGNAIIWKCVCAALILVLNTMPLRWLSYTSIVGILSTFCSGYNLSCIGVLMYYAKLNVVVCIVITDGLIKDHTPGSLWEPATTYLLPSNWLSLPLAYGLMASPWGAHSVFPSVRT